MGGSWGFIITFAVVLVSWMLINSEVLTAFGLTPFDGYPYIFLNLMLSMLAAIQAPVLTPTPIPGQAARTAATAGPTTPASSDSSPPGPRG